MSVLLTEIIRKSVGGEYSGKSYANFLKSPMRRSILDTLDTCDLSQAYFAPISR